FVPLVDALLDRSAVLVGHRLLDVELDALLGYRELVGVLGIDRLRSLQPPAVDVANEGGVLALAAEVLDRGDEVANAIIGDARLIAAVGQLRQAIVNDHGLTAVVDVAVIVEPPKSAAAIGRLHLQLDVARKRLDLVPDAALIVELAEERQLG